MNRPDIRYQQRFIAGPATIRNHSHAAYNNAESGGAGKTSRNDVLPLIYQEFTDAYGFIDGAMVVGELRRFSELLGFKPTLNLHILINFMRAHRIFWFDASTSEADDRRGSVRVDNPERYHGLIRETEGIALRLGDFKAGERQKEVDILLAVEALKQAGNRSMRRAVFLVADQDFRPVLQQVSDYGISVELCCPVAKTSRQLLQAADHVINLTPHFWGHLAGKFGGFWEIQGGEVHKNHTITLAGVEIEVRKERSRGIIAFFGDHAIDGFGGMTSKDEVQGALEFVFKELKADVVERVRDLEQHGIFDP